MIPDSRVSIMPLFVKLIEVYHGEPMKVLDLGCGKLSRLWVKRYEDRYEGLDREAFLNVTWIQDIDKGLHNFKNDSYDLVTGWSLPEHLLRPYEMLREAVRISSETCIFTTDYTEMDKNRDPSHYYSWTPKTFQQLFDIVHKPNKVFVSNRILVGVLQGCSTSGT